jgi:hypothetical protein
MVDTTLLHCTDKQEILQTLFPRFVPQSPVYRWVHDQQVLMGRFSRGVAFVHWFSCALFGTIEAINHSHMFLGGYVNVIIEVSPRSRASRHKFPPMLNSCGVMTGVVLLQTRTLLLDYPMGFFVQMFLRLVETG